MYAVKWYEVKYYTRNNVKYYMLLFLSPRSQQQVNPFFELSIFTQIVL